MLLATALDEGWPIDLAAATEREHRIGRTRQAALFAVREAKLAQAAGMARDDAIRMLLSIVSELRAE